MEEEGINMHERQEALAKFRESLSLPLTERFYDEDELIDYFDFASDLNDDYLRMEVLMCAARLYPKSEELLERKAVFYSQYSDDVMDKCVEDHPNATGVIWDIMRAKNARIESSRKKIEILDAILTKYDHFNDEEIIQFIGLATSYQQLQWLKDNLGTLQQKAIFSPVLLYEVAVAAEMNGDSEYAIELMQRLTDIDPFNADFWVVLAKEYVQTEQLEKGLSALEYAVAIDPENAETLSIKAKLLFMMDGNQDEILSLAYKIETLDGMNRDLLKVIGLIYQARGETYRTIEAYERFMHRHPEQLKDTLIDMILFAPTDTDRILDRIYSIDNNINNWISWAEEYEEVGATSLSASVIIAFCRNSQIVDPPFEMIELTFRLGLFELTERISSNYRRSTESALATTMPDNSDYPAGTSVIFFTIHLITKLKLGKIEEATMLIPEISRHDLISSFPDVKDRLSILGFSKLLNNIITILNKHGENYDWSTFDPLSLWSNGNGVDQYPKKDNNIKR